MPRRARLRLAGYPQHIVQRGHNRSVCFRQPSDFQLYLGLLDELRRPFDCHVHAFVLMSNHVHLLLTSDSETGPSELLRRLNIRFVQAVNRRHRLTGTAWEGRFWSSVIGGADYFLRCQRYIELMPVRAGMVVKPATYFWSSHACNAMGVPCTVVEPHAEYLSLGREERARMAAYRRLFDKPMSEAELSAIRESLRSCLPYGSDAFVTALELASGRRLRLVRPRGVAIAA
jgi:putative transposase